MWTRLCQEQNLKVPHKYCWSVFCKEMWFHSPPGVNEKPLAWHFHARHFHARQFQNFYFWQSVTFCNIQFWSNGVPLIDCLKTIEIFWRARQTVSEYPRLQGFRFAWTNIHPCPNPSSSLNKNRPDFVILPGVFLCDLVQAQSAIKLFAKQQNNSLNVP